MFECRYIGAEKESRDGKEVIIDRYAVPQRHVQQVGGGRRQEAGKEGGGGMEEERARKRVC